MTGSTRLKAGTAQAGAEYDFYRGDDPHPRVYNNLMVDVEATNAKPIERLVSIVMEATNAIAQPPKRAGNLRSPLQNGDCDGAG